MAATTDTGQPRKLRRNLSVWEAIGISLALMAPSMAANINPQGTATTVGRAVPIAFALAFVGVLLVAYTFVRLTQRFHHSGSVYGFVGATLGPRAGVISGWAGSFGTTAQTAFTSSNGSVYKGLAISSAADMLYAADFHNGHVDVFDGSFMPVKHPGAFEDPLPSGLGLFGPQSRGVRPSHIEQSTTLMNIGLPY